MQENNFFGKNRSNEIREKVIVEYVKRINEKTSFVSNAIKQIGYPLWNKCTIIATKYSGNSFAQNNDSTHTYYIPFVRDSQNYVNASLIITARPTDTTYRFKYDWDYKYFQNNTSATIIDSAEEYAIFFMKLSKSVFEHKKFRILDKTLFKNNNEDAAWVELPDTTIQNNLYELPICTFITVIYERLCNFGKSVTNTSNNSAIIRCFSSFSFSSCTDGSGGYGGPSGGTGLPTGGVPNGNGGGCAGCGGGGQQGPLNGVGNTGWMPASNDEIDENGFYYARILQLDSLLSDNPYSSIPCDSLEILSTFGQMFQRVGNYQVPQNVLNRLDSIKSISSTIDSSSYFIQSLNDGASTVVNCDFFPVKIIQLPINYSTGLNFTPSEFLEFFRKNINLFSTPDVIFKPYNSINFNDSLHWFKDTLNSLGSVLHIEMTVNGSVILSGYENSINFSNYQKHSFVFSTLVTPLDNYHPVSGNRKFGIYTDINPNGGYTFYSMGVDRISKNSYVLGSFFSDIFTGNSGFENADILCTTMQINMINYINSHGGIADTYPRTNYKIRPLYADIESFLRGVISLEELKIRLGC